MVEPVESHFMWRPLLRDPADEMVLEAAANGRAATIVTFNQRDFGAVPQQFGVEVLMRAVALRRIKYPFRSAGIATQSAPRRHAATGCRGAPVLVLRGGEWFRIVRP